MASSISIRFYPIALARPNTNARNPRKPLPRKLSKSNANNRTRSQGRPQPSLSTVPGGDATTYTRLPPKDEFGLPSLDSSPHSSTVVKLSESKVAAPKTSSKGSEREKEDSSSNLEFDYEKFELFEVNSDNEHDDEDEDDDDKDYVDYGGEMLEFEEGEDGIDGGEEVKEKEKGVPAVMRCFDRAKIFVKAGDGGNGVVAFRREMYVPLGGPSGGDGGRGGNVYVEVDGSMNSLLPFRQNIHFRAGRGSHGQGRKMHGAKGEDVVVKVAPGTVIREAVVSEEGERGEGVVLLELLYPGQRALLLPGGRGGRGNASFKSGNNKVPRIAENGEEGPEM